MKVHDHDSASDPDVQVCWRAKNGNRHTATMALSAYSEFVKGCPHLHTVALVSNTAEASETPGSGASASPLTFEGPRSWHPSRGGAA